MHPPKNPEVSSRYDLATRWAEYECFLKMFPRYLIKQAEEGNARALWDVSMNKVENYIRSGELEAIDKGFVEGLIPSYKEYDIVGSSIDSLERRLFPECFGDIGKDNDMQEYSAFDRDSEFYAEELDIAVMVHRAVAEKGQGDGSTPRKRILDWLSKHYREMKDEKKERIAMVANWQKGPGRRKKK